MVVHDNRYLLGARARWGLCWQPWTGRLELWDLERDQRVDQFDLQLPSTVRPSAAAISTDGCTVVIGTSEGTCLELRSRRPPGREVA